MEEELKKIRAFMDKYNNMNLSPLYVSYKYLIAQIPPEDSPKVIEIYDEECDRLTTIATFDEFLFWFIPLILKEMYEQGQDNLRKAVQQLLGLRI